VTWESQRELSMITKFCWFRRREAGIKRAGDFPKAMLKQAKAPSKQF